MELDGYISSFMERVLTRRNHLKRLSATSHQIQHFAKDLVKLKDELNSATLKSKWIPYGRNKLDKIIREIFLPNVNYFIKYYKGQHLLALQEPIFEPEKRCFVYPDEISKKIKALESLVSICADILNILPINIRCENTKTKSATNSNLPTNPSSVRSGVRVCNKYPFQGLTTMREEVLYVPHVLQRHLKKSSLAKATFKKADVYYYDAFNDDDYNMVLNYVYDMGLSMITDEELKAMKEERQKKDLLRQAEMAKILASNAKIKAGRLELNKEEERMKKYISQIEAELFSKRKELQKSEEDLKAASEKLFQMSGDLDGASKKLEITRQQLKEAQERVARLENDNKELQKRIDLLNGEKQKLADEIAALKKSEKELKANAEAEIKRMSDKHVGEVKQLQQACERLGKDAKTEIAKLEKNHQLAITKITTDTKEEHEKISQVANQKQAEIQRLSSVIGELQQELTSSHAEKDALMESLRDLNTQNEALYQERQAHLDWTPSNDVVASFLPSFSSFSNAASASSPQKGLQNGIKNHGTAGSAFR